MVLPTLASLSIGQCAQLTIVAPDGTVCALDATGAGTLRSNCTIVGPGGGVGGAATLPTSDYASCTQIKEASPDAASGVYMVRPFPNRLAFKVFCDMETHGGGWTLFNWRSVGGGDPFALALDECPAIDSEADLASSECAGRIPASARPRALLIQRVDDPNNWAAWDFDASNALSSLTLAAMQYKTQGCHYGTPWMPVAVGSATTADSCAGGTVNSCSKDGDEATCCAFAYLNVLCGCTGSIGGPGGDGVWDRRWAWWLTDVVVVQSLQNPGVLSLECGETLCELLHSGAAPALRLLVRG